ncbi:hypothetical protein TL18_09030 [Methanobrevibacter sp. YE315]|uniref:hypothetical protein n=1 Tax=Methanobrevibacter sp. YE315 TaxID=1609968 RepID=UPI000764D838|nr:hypothetical protein [Methanobrevibacter sp. YE315]AMD18145.1 hypothetical protein TL18_09030 [Methanobrevibacter sp. YE315]
MIKKEYLIIAILLVIIFAVSMAIVNQTSSDDNIVTHEILANDTSHDPGSVEIIRNIGNPNSKKIAYVVGVHPLEYQTHETLLKILPTLTDLNYCYDIYVINVTQDKGHYGDGYSDSEDPGRQNGQNLALKYVYPEIVDGNYELAIDVHSNIGAYDYKTFVFSPVKDSASVKYAEDVAFNSPNIFYYAPDSTTSGPYLTIPLNENGVPAFYFEEYSFAPQDVKDAHMLELIRAVDNLDFK